MRSNDIQVNYPDPGFWSETSLIQLGYGIWVNLTMATLGLAYGFSAIAIPQMNASDSNVTVTVSDASWIASIITLFAPVGCIMGGYIIDRFGRRKMLIYSHLPLCFGWMFIGVASTATNIIIGRIIVGVGMGMAMSAPRVYMTEVCLPNMRGIIGAFPNIAMAAGITFQAGLGSLLNWRILCYINGAYAIILFLCNFRLPETPYFLLKNATLPDAEDALRCFRSKDFNIDSEMCDLIDFKTDNDICRLTFRQQLSALKKRSACKPFWIMTGYTFLGELSGTSIISMWTVDMLQNSKLSIEAEIGNLVIGFTRIAAGFVGAILIFNAGRRPLAIGSGLGAGITYITLGLLLMYWDEKTLVPLICYMLYVLCVGMCFYTLPPLILYELYPLQVRGLLGGITISNLNMFIFVANKCYQYVRDFFGYSNMIINFGVWAVICSIYLYFVLPETKDLTLQEIEEYYNARRPTLASERRLRSMQVLSTINARRATKSLELISERQKKDSKNKMDKVSGLHISGSKNKNKNKNKNPNQNQNPNQDPNPNLNPNPNPNPNLNQNPNPNQSQNQNSKNNK